MPRTCELDGLWTTGRPKEGKNLGLVQGFEAKSEDLDLSLLRAKRSLRPKLQERRKVLSSAEDQGRKVSAGGGSATGKSGCQRVLLAMPVAALRLTAAELCHTKGFSVSTKMPIAATKTHVYKAYMRVSPRGTCCCDSASYLPPACQRPHFPQETFPGFIDYPCRNNRSVLMEDAKIISYFYSKMLPLTEI